MIKATVTPKNTDLHISIPPGYVGKKIEVILYSLEEADALTTPLEKKAKPSDFAGTLSTAEATALLNYVAQSRNEWERDI